MDRDCARSPPISAAVDWDIGRDAPALEISTSAESQISLLDIADDTPAPIVSESRTPAIAETIPAEL